MKHFKKIATSIGMVAGIMGALPAIAQTELIYNSYLPPFDETYQIGIRDFAKAIEAESGGTITVTIPDSTLAPSDRQFEMVRDGIADMAVMQVESISQYVTLNELGGLPGMAPTAEAGSVAMWETYNKFFKDVGEFPGVMVLSTHTLPGRDILALGDLKINSVADIKGKRIWATARPFIDATEEMGAVPILTQFSELQEFAARGDLDAAFISAGSAASAGILDMTGQIARLPGGFGTQSFVIVISEERWNEMDEGQQAAILRASDGLSRRLGAANDASEEEVADKVTEIGINTFEGDALDQFKAVVAPQIEDWIVRAKDAGLQDPQAAIDFYQSVVQREIAD